MFSRRIGLEIRRKTVVFTNLPPSLALILNPRERPLRPRQSESDFECTNGPVATGSDDNGQARVCDGWTRYCNFLGGSDSQKCLPYMEAGFSIGRRMGAFRFSPDGSARMPKRSVSVPDKAYKSGRKCVDGHRKNRKIEFDGYLPKSNDWAIPKSL